MRLFLIGAAGGVGSSLARRLHSLGYDVILVGRTEASLAALGSELNAPHVVVDATNFDHLDRAMQQYAPLNGVVNCAGSLLLKPAHLLQRRTGKILSLST